MRKDIPSLGVLQAFEASARLQSFSRAAEELALTRNTTEGIETVLLGLRWTAGDEVVTGGPLVAGVVEAD